MVTPNCVPRGSEGLIGFQMARSIGKYVDAVVATHCYFESGINTAGGLDKQSLSTSICTNCRS